jgi:GTP-binding protein
MAKLAQGPAVVLVGRPNVGKSTLFNRITGTRRSIVAPIAGTTRDVIEQPATWQQRAFQLMDTGGLFGHTTDPLHVLVVERGLRALNLADLIIFVVDGREGMVPGDQEIAAKLRKLGCPVILAINKTDDKKGRKNAADFQRLGFDPVFEIAAEHGDGVAELLEEVRRKLPNMPMAVDDTPPAPEPDEADDEDAEIDYEAEAALLEVKAAEEAAKVDREIAVAIVGRPNVGKSSLVNRLLREERMVVSDMPGTTRDAVDVVLKWEKKTFRLVDTAGMRKPGKVKDAGQIESVSVLIAKRAMTQADVAVIVIDAVEGATDRDAAIAGEAQTLGLGVVIAVNKWDLVKGQDQDWVKKFDDRLRYHLKFLDYAPLIHISALTGDRTSRVLQTVHRIAVARRRKIKTSQLNAFFERITKANPPTTKARHDVRILYAVQTAIEPPEFMIFTNVASELHFSYERFLMNQLREEFGFEGTPIRLKVRRRKKRERK